MFSLVPRSQGLAGWAKKMLIEVPGTVGVLGHLRALIRGQGAPHRAGNPSRDRLERGEELVGAVLVG